MRLPASEKLEIIHLVEQSHLPARRTLEMLGIKPSTFYRWYDRFRTGGLVTTNSIEHTHAANSTIPTSGSIRISLRGLLPFSSSSGRRVAV